MGTGLERRTIEAAELSKRRAGEWFGVGEGERAAWEGEVLIPTNERKAERLLLESAEKEDRDTASK